nr:hypothetical protein [uncultured Dysosmobacter sp.]
MNKKKVTIIVGVVIAAIIIIGAVIAAILLGSSDNSINQPTNTANTEDSEIYAPEFDSSGPEIEIDESPILDVPPEVDWEEPPVLTYYNEDVDTNSDGHVDKTEWEVWVSKHPEDLNQDMIISDEEKAAYESNDEEAKEEYQPTKAEDIKEPTEEELDAINEAGREAAEAAGQGLGGLINREPPSNSNPDAFKDNQSEGNAGINVE